jgi:hypothetical protein
VMNATSNFRLCFRVQGQNGKQERVISFLDRLIECSTVEDGPTAVQIGHSTSTGTSTI